MVVSASGPAQTRTTRALKVHRPVRRRNFGKAKIDPVTSPANLQAHFRP